MARRGLSHTQLEQLVSEQAAIAALRDRVTSELVEPYFAAHREEFDRARIVRCLCHSEDAARAVYDAIRAGAVDFFGIAQTRFLAQLGSTPPADLFATISRGTSPAPLADAVFNAVPGDLIGPVPVGDQFAVARVLSIEPSVLDEATRKAIKQQLFTEWLDERRQMAEIEWNWGNAARTARAS
jgi:putative peptide maturation system protein